MLMKTFRPNVFIIVEQPVSSWLFKQKNFVDVAKKWSLCRHLTNMGLFGGDLLKPTHLMSNLPTLTSVERRATKSAKAKFDSRISRKKQRAIEKGQRVKVYYVRSASGKFSGGPDLSLSAVYPHAFILGVYKAWQRQVL